MKPPSLSKKDRLGCIFCPLTTHPIHMKITQKIGETVLGKSDPKDVSSRKTEETRISFRQKCVIGITAGFLNGLFGSGGGVAAVPLLERSKLEQRKCHATSVLLIFVLSLFSAGMYALGGKLDYSTAVEFIPAGLAGALVGAVLLKKVKNTLLKRVFGVIILISAVRMLMI